MEVARTGDWLRRCTRDWLEHHLLAAARSALAALLATPLLAKTRGRQGQETVRVRLGIAGFRNLIACPLIECRAKGAVIEVQANADTYTIVGRVRAAWRFAPPAPCHPRASSLCFPVFISILLPIFPRASATPDQYLAPAPSTGWYLAIYSLIRMEFLWVAAYTGRCIDVMRLTVLATRCAARRHSSEGMAWPRPTLRVFTCGAPSGYLHMYRRRVFVAPRSGAAKARKGMAPPVAITNSVPAPIEVHPC